jgi:hypothetical protein
MMISFVKDVQVVLEKKKLQQVKARVALVLDITGSMRPYYKNGTVQKVVERILAVASQFDDDQTLDVWVYDHRFSRLPSVTEQDFENYVNRAILENAAVEKFGRNDEPLVMRDIIAKYTQEEPSSLPTYITFINDGGVKKGANEAGDSVQKLIIESATKPLFWQFVGLGNADFGVLKKLDTIEGRFVDNANFFQIDNIDTISNAALYDLLLNEFPLWLEEAKQKGVLA